MYFMIYTEDKADSLHIRTENRDAHLAWLRSDPAITLRTAGPWLDDDGDMRGSLLLVDAVDKASVKAWLSNDPYRKAGLTARTIVHAYHWVIGTPSPQG